MRRSNASYLVRGMTFKKKTYQNHRPKKQRQKKADLGNAVRRQIERTQSQQPTCTDERSEIDDSAGPLLEWASDEDRKEKWRCTPAHADLRNIIFVLFKSNRWNGCSEKAVATALSADICAGLSTRRMGVTYEHQRTAHGILIAIVNCSRSARWWILRAVTLVIHHSHISGRAICIHRFQIMTKWALASFCPLPHRKCRSKRIAMNALACETFAVQLCTVNGFRSANFAFTHLIGCLRIFEQIAIWSITWQLNGWSIKSATVRHTTKFDWNPVWCISNKLKWLFSSVGAALVNCRYESDQIMSQWGTPTIFKWYMLTCSRNDIFGLFCLRFLNCLMHFLTNGFFDLSQTSRD